VHLSFGNSHQRDDHRFIRRIILLLLAVTYRNFATRVKSRLDPFSFVFGGWKERSGRYSGRDKPGPSLARRGLLGVDDPLLSAKPFRRRAYPSTRRVNESYNFMDVPLHNSFFLLKHLVVTGNLRIPLDNIYHGCPPNSKNLAESAPQTFSAPSGPVCSALQFIIFCGESHHDKPCIR
jgi:hypothetical protein